MKKFSILFLSSAAIWSLSSSSLFGAALVLAFDSGGFMLQNSSGVNLTGGSAAAQFDGEIIQVGYFSGAATDNNNFLGTWIPITGEGSPNFVSNTRFDTTVGDDSQGLGFGPPFNQFAISVNVDSTIQVGLPPVGTRMAIRIYDKSSIQASAAFVTFSSNLWKWPVATTLTDPTSRLDMTLADAGLRIENRSGAGGVISTPNGSAAVPDGNGNFRTNIPVPEPSSSLLALAGCVAFFARRRSK